jgi:hypothetical protein
MVEAEKVTVGLVREADNEFDANAIAVTVNVNKNKPPHKIGYLPRELAAYMSRLTRLPAGRLIRAST